ncbi:MAG: deaminase [Amycolatopsis sp.]|uniref:dihydrofolate reductase family protein n=1 Tax=Amycolatopsis sp. TaxID=37632 RepID=UPI0026019F4C|nr:dihydrofolate reductase family protein [Amycolatopsis sp.]MCU1680875.1 deaminase [Amycolatopsis sp.]
MGKISVVDNLTLDGVMQAPGRPDEDPRGGFSHGGWALPYTDEVMSRAMAEGMAGNRGAFLFGRRTYEDFYGFWPDQTDNPFTDVLTEGHKYVASRTLEAPLPWSNSTLLEGDAADAVAGIEEDLLVFGSGDLLQSLMRRDLVDTYLLLIHPLLLGTGNKLFNNAAGPLRLINSVTTTTGVIMATYEPAR